MFIRCPYKDESPCEKEFASGEACLVLTDECGSKYSFRLQTYPETDVLTTTIDKLVQQLVTLFTRTMPVTLQDIINLNIICPYSSLTAIDRNFGETETSGVFIGDSALEALREIFNLFQTVPREFNSYEVTSRIISSDVIMLNVVLNLLDAERRVLATLTLSGQFHILDCGTKLCVDSLSAFAIRTLIG